MPDIPLSVGRKLELLRTFVFDKCPYTSPYTHAFVRVCIILPCMYMYMYVYISYIIQCIYMTQRRRGFCTLVPSFFKYWYFHADIDDNQIKGPTHDVLMVGVF